MNNVLSFFQESSERVEHFLDKKFVNSSIYTAKLTEGMRYSLFAGGKRLRPALVYASYGIFQIIMTMLLHLQQLLKFSILIH